MKPLKKLQDLSDRVKATPSLEEAFERETFSVIEQDQWSQVRRDILDFGGGWPLVCLEKSDGVFFKLFLSEVEKSVNVFVKTENPENLVKTFLKDINYVV